MQITISFGGERKLNITDSHKFTPRRNFYESQSTINGSMDFAEELSLK